MAYVPPLGIPPNRDNLRAILDWLLYSKGANSVARAVYYQTWEKELLALKAEADEPHAIATAGL